MYVTCAGDDESVAECCSLHQSFVGGPNDAHCQLGLCQIDSCVNAAPANLLPDLVSSIFGQMILLACSPFA